MSLSMDLIRALGWTGADLQRVINTAPARYKVYGIPKRHGAGVRIIAQPSRELKAIQRYVLHNKLALYPVHEAAMAYCAGRNIRQNAERHQPENVILKLDFQDFFPSIKVRDWEKYARRIGVDGVDLDDIKLYSRIMFWGRERRSTVPRCLSIGAPTSPALSNILMYDFDVALFQQAEEMGVRYTRYADDITISATSEDAVLSFEKRVVRAVRALKSPKLAFNDEKRGLYKRGQRRMVTGLIVTPDRKVSIGRERKRLISAMLNRSSQDLLDLLGRSRLKGLLGFSIAAEPEFLGRLRIKYGNDVVDAALSFHAPKRAEMIPAEG
jgi:RNA-directed DNA polymerase